MEVAGYDLLADLERSTVNFESVRKLVEHCADLELTCGNEKLTAGLYTFSVSGNYYRNVDDDRFCIVYCEEVYMEAEVLDRMPLKLVETGADFLAVAELEVDDVRVRSVGDRFESLCVNSEVDVLHSESVDVARYESFLAESLDGLLSGSFTKLTFEFNVFHCT